MAYLIEVAPPTAAEGDLITLRAPGRNMVQPQRGDRIFLWWTETQGGLAAHGQIFDAHPEGRDWVLRIEIRGRTSRLLGRHDVAPYRGVHDGSPLANLANDFYRHSHNKVAPLTPAAAAFLESYFDS